MSTNVDFYGLYQFQYQTVAAVICGLDCGNYQVDQQGHISVPLQSDPDKLFTANYVQQFDVGPWNKTAYGMLTTRVTMLVQSSGEMTMYVPVFIGYPYLCAGQLMRPVTPEQTKSGQGGGTGKNKRVYNYGVLVQSTVGLAIGTTFANLEPVTFTTRGGYVLKHNQPFTGVAYGATEDEVGMDGMLCWAVERPYPCTINALNSFIGTEERSSAAGETGTGAGPAAAGGQQVSPMGEEVPR